jgi:hypothetical protein
MATELRNWLLENQPPRDTASCARARGPSHSIDSGGEKDGGKRFAFHAAVGWKGCSLSLGVLLFTFFVAVIKIIWPMTKALFVKGMADLEDGAEHPDSIPYGPPELAHETPPSDNSLMWLLLAFVIVLAVVLLLAVVRVARRRMKRKTGDH